MTAIALALGGYRLCRTVDADTGDALPLVDALTTPGESSIASGQEELAALIDHVQGEVLYVLRRRS